MKMHWSEFGAAAVLVGLAGSIVYAGLRWSLRHALDEQKEESDRRLAAMGTEIKALESRIAELSRLAAERAGEVASENSQSTGAKEEASPEVVAVIAAAATTYLGKKAQIRTAKLVPATETVSSWTQQGRMIVQTSHNLRGRE